MSCEGPTEKLDGCFDIFNRQSYDVEIEVVVEGTGVRSSNVLDLKNPFFRYTGVQTPPPPGNHTGSPTETYWGNAGVNLNGAVIGNSGSSYVGGGGGQPSGNYSSAGKRQGDYEYF